MLFTPRCVSRGTAFIKFGFRGAENKSDIDVRALLFDQKMFLSITYREYAFCLNVKVLVSVTHFEVRGIASITSWIGKLDLVGLVFDRQTMSFYLLSNSLF